MLLVYSIIDEQSFEEMGRWLLEMRENIGSDIVLHIVGTKSDVVAQDPSLRKIPFERCVAYAAENMGPEAITTPSATTGSAGSIGGMNSLDGASKRSSTLWGQDIGWNCCNEISSSNGEGIDEVFRVITRKLVEQKQRKADLEHASANATTPGNECSQGGYFDGSGLDGHGNFRVGVGDKRRSWLGFPAPNVGIGDESNPSSQQRKKANREKCC